MKETDLKDHKQVKKILTPPLSGIPKLTYSSWLHERLPDMLWAVLVIGNTKRSNALNFFRYVGKYVEKNKEFAEITLTNISNQDEKKIEKFISHLLNYSKEIKNILRPMALYPKLPAFKIWKKFLEDPIPKEDWQKISEGILKTFDHQSEKATDCRWIKVLCLMIGGKMKFPREQKEKVENIFRYPESGDLRKVRPTIRAMEIAITIQKNNSSWHDDFWEYNYNSTACMPEEAFHDKIKKRQEKLQQEIKNQKKYYLGEIKRVKDKLISHFFDSYKTTKVDSRAENSFGLTLYGLAFITEIIIYNISSSILGRTALRSLIDSTNSPIIFSYLTANIPSSRSVTTSGKTSFTSCAITPVS